MDIIKKEIYNLIREILSLHKFELEYLNRTKTDPFAKKWLSSTRTRLKIQKLHTFLILKLKIYIDEIHSEHFFQSALKPITNISLNRIKKELFPQDQTTINDTIYNSFIYSSDLGDLFVIFTNLINWEHMKYPFILKSIIFKRMEKYISENGENSNEFDVQKYEIYSNYYIRFLDILSSNAIESVFDLDALETTIKNDFESAESNHVDKNNLYRNWPIPNEKRFNERFPDFKENIEKKNINLT